MAFQQPYRQEYPRPQFERSSWMNLNGTWSFDFDDAGQGEREAWYNGHEYGHEIQVPFCFQSKLSGIGETGFRDTVWYETKVTLDPKQGKRTLLHFGAVDYLAKVWVNGRLVKVHEGGHTPFWADVTLELVSGENTITVMAQDYSEDVSLPRGKQYWKEKSASIWYTNTTGIWQTVWIEEVSETHLSRLRWTPDIDTNEIQLDASIAGWTGKQELELQVAITFQGEPVSKDRFSIQGAEESRRIRLKDFNDHGLGRWWSPEKPNLYDVELKLLVDGEEADRVTSYFGMRKISIVDGQICLNNRPYCMKLVLDQGYFPDGILTPPSDDAIRNDVELTKAMGFNGARKHQKLEDPRYLYWCDKLGLLLWSEMANAYVYSQAYQQRFTQEWIEAVERDYSHPCIVAWVPLNESWGVPNILVDRFQQAHALAMYHLTRAMDQTRLVISNDGWEHVQSDICTIHDYEWRQEVLDERYSTAESAVSARPANRWIYVPGYKYQGEPILVSEFGGISFKKSEWEGWGYSGAVDEADFVARLKAVIEPMQQSPVVQGYCYTQLTDVEQEINGLLTYDRQPKVPVEVIKQINDGNARR
ncbi:glycoside hydrolase family 2 protein [Paenibacillus cremeus]|uniref:Glycoside hydrolase family 2 n=1 Tax=Paenibacillus cremeus TaxID=2163881 RepID=A0A559KE53_9BACL|nr:sugar-binding domain-containing protein [Paenibacillus cremeus]TVY10401.1 glycoside hydrolase family 2 [Paenibacillus cremeus]